jgi:hypothetical protein
LCYNNFTVPQVLINQSTEFYPLISFCQTDASSYNFIFLSIACKMATGLLCNYRLRPVKPAPCRFPDEFKIVQYFAAAQE